MALRLGARGCQERSEDQRGEDQGCKTHQQPKITTRASPRNNYFFHLSHGLRQVLMRYILERWHSGRSIHIVVLFSSISSISSYDTFFMVLFSSISSL